MQMWRIVSAGAVLLLACSCSPLPEKRIVYRDRVVEVEVPVAVAPVVPEALVSALARPQLTWHPPGSTQAAVCLSDSDTALLRDSVWQWLQRLDAWRAWALEVGETPEPPSN